MTTHRSTLVFAALAAVCATVIAAPARAAEALQFTVDPSWPKTLPNNWVMGQIGGMTVDAQDNIWVLQRSPHAAAFQMLHARALGDPARQGRKRAEVVGRSRERRL
jgi:hypothetical protein